MYCCTQRTFAKVVYLFHIRNYLEKSAFYLHESHIYDTDRLQMCYSGRLFLFYACTDTSEWRLLGCCARSAFRRTPSGRVAYRELESHRKPRDIPQISYGGRLTRRQFYCC